MTSIVEVAKLLTGKSVDVRRYLIPLIAFLLLSAVTWLTKDEAKQYLYIVPALLFLPFIGGRFGLPDFTLSRARLVCWGILVSILISIVLVDAHQAREVLSLTLNVAIPEEWFFRVYLLAALGGGAIGNLLSSLCFASLHMVTTGWLHGTMVIVPSLFYGWVYIKTGDFILVVLLHALSNIFFISFLVNYV